MKKLFPLAIGSVLLGMSGIASAQTYNVDAYINGSYTPKFQTCDILTIYSQSEVLTECSQTSPAQNFGTGTLEFYMPAFYQGTLYFCDGAVNANGAQQTYYVQMDCT